jgi:hypothetical protein
LRQAPIGQSFIALRRRVGSGVGNLCRGDMRPNGCAQRKKERESAQPLLFFFARRVEVAVEQQIR